MTTTRSLLAAVMAAASLSAAPARATVLTYTFGGTITDVEVNNYPGALPSVGEMVSGKLTVVTPRQWDSYETDGTTVNYAQVNGPAGTVSGNLTFSDGSSFSMSGAVPGSVEELILRNATGNQNEIAVSTTTEEDGYDRVISLVLWDIDGAASTLFADPDGGVSFSQPINPAGEQQGVYFGAESLDFSSSFIGVYDLTDLRISAVVPEPSNVALLLVGLCGLQLASRRGRTARPSRSVLSATRMAPERLRSAMATAPRRNRQPCCPTRGTWCNWSWLRWSSSRRVPASAPSGLPARWHRRPCRC